VFWTQLSSFAALRDAPIHAVSPTLSSVDAMNVFSSGEEMLEKNHE
jgi:hypothetical protein